MNQMDWHQWKLNISDLEVAELQQCFAANGIAGCNEYLTSKLDQWKKNPLNIAVIGNSGVGKSTFINSIRRLKKTDPLAAKTGIKQKTMKPEPYAHPVNPNLIFWDLPGVGTNSFKKETYLQTIDIEIYDFFLIISSSRFTENDIWLGCEIRKLQKRFFFVRSQVDIDLQKHRQSTDYADDPINILYEDIRENLEEIKQQGTGSQDEEIKVFLINGLEPAAFDFEKLETDLVANFPEFKRQALIFSLSALSVDMVKLKVAALSKDIWITSILSGSVAAIPVPGVSAVADIGFITLHSAFMYRTLGLDSESLKKTAHFLKADVSTLQAVADAAFPVTLFSTQGIRNFLLLVPSAASEFVAEEFVRFVPFIGSVVGAVLSLSTTYAALQYILSRMETAAIKVFEAAANSATYDSVD